MPNTCQIKGRFSPPPHGNVRIWSADTGKIASPPIFQRNLTCVSLSKDGRRILTGDSVGNANWLGRSDREALREFPSKEPVTNVQISDDGATLAIAQLSNGDAVVTTWNSKNWCEYPVLQ